MTRYKEPSEDRKIRGEPIFRFIFIHTSRILTQYCKSERNFSDAYEA